ncbi:nucleotidyltransferase domain-containing protein [Pedobacter sp. GR22-6]|uniref:nucleotidyltransferase domain-containing protein n=1 Tax=Pedobacter sp. GR22-6 TaxID=3127957 RepID=UPI00307E41E6
MKKTILKKLLELEQSENIKVLYACESGSRAWGFASPDSDFDVRFIYTRSANDYLSIANAPDTVGLPVDEVLDIGGWDIKKALKLFLKSNGPLYEWLQSPIVYRQHPAFASEMRALMPNYFSLRSAANHYLSMAYNTFRDDLQSDQVKMKRYFYALRPVLACSWIIERQSVPPMEFEHLRVLITDPKVQHSIDELLAQKLLVDEKTMIAPVALLNDWLTTTLSLCKEQVPTLPSLKPQIHELDQLFRKYIMS